MKKTILLSIITFILMLGLVGSIYYFYDLSKEKDILTTCSLTVNTSENEKVKVDYEINHKKEGTIINITKLVNNEYSNEETYKVAKEYYGSLDGYEMDDVELVITSKEEILFENETWSKSYIENLKSMEYSCSEVEV